MKDEAAFVPPGRPDGNTLPTSCPDHGQDTMLELHDDNAAGLSLFNNTSLVIAIFRRLVKIQ